MIETFAIIAAVVGFIPGGSFILIPMEMILLWNISHKYGKFHFGEWLGFGEALWTISLVLIGLASILHINPLIGQLANSIVAAGAIYVIGKAAESHYSK